MRLVIALLIGTVLTTAACAADWTPPAWASASTLDLRTTAAGEQPRWFPVWLVVVDGQLYVRLGARAAGRIAGNITKPVVGVRIGGTQFDRVRGEPAPEIASPVAEAMAAKYWFDVLVRHVDHPLTLRLVPE